ncbi:transcriptional regulator with HTH domain and aminotransferase domain [Rivularia sp. PCC 7116]|uniref:MocR-like pyridoxine biosynthesis transcription factor PdxR n=1 Tax=Rivularia sp. PCC 7116 TaxID=373994 RepID=UPI00029F3E00|nr:PLP-dependent aminotransferase family protein [Rivularia sp. PCC 7116]AFY53119.1 transcriptional regulator with HTH domain and aminotransferase domain [Rivularia sp. PCC 7116]
MDLAIILDSNLSKSLHQQLYEQLRQAILSGRLAPGERIPSTRFLAKSLSISRFTVTTSYEQLLSEGYLETVKGAGTFVCQQIPDNLIELKPIECIEKSNASSIKLSQYGKTLADIENVPRISEPKLQINFRYGTPALSEFPIKIWRRLLSRYCNASFNWLDYSQEPNGYQPLREAIKRYLARCRAVNCEPEQILITNGTQQALDLILRLLIEPRETIAIENPGYLSARIIFETQQAQILPVSVDSSGLLVKELANQTEKNVRLVYVTPSHQFPTGAILSLPRRLELLNWAQQNGALIIEDDYDSEFRYGEKPIPALQGLDTSDSVLYIGTFSKVLFPSLRIGYLVLPRSLVAIFARAKWLSDRHLPILEQQALTDFIESGYLERHIRKMRSIYNQRRQTLVKAIKKHFGKRAQILGEKAGIHVMVRFKSSLSDEEIIKSAAKVGIGMMSAKPHYLTAHSRCEFIFGYGELTETQLTEGIRKLAEIMFR